MVELLNSIHFLRPWWFLALLPVAWIIWQIWQTNRKQGAWHEVIAPKFRKLLLGENTTAEATVNEKLGYIVLAFAWFFAIVALSGPWVKSIDIPAQKSQQGIVIVLDLSLSMLADDLPPNRLARVKYKLTDLLKQHPEFATGMVAYAGSAHTISPISEDNQTLLGLLPSLSPVMMPKYGAKPIKGLDLAIELIKGAQITNGHIIWITDDIEESEVNQIADWFNNHDVSMTIMTVGTNKGGVVQVPNYGLLKDTEDKLIMPSMPFDRFAKLAQTVNIKWVELKPEDASVDALLPPVITAKNQQTDTTLSKEVNHPLDIGAYFLFFLIPLVAFIYRRGTLLSLLVITIMPIGLMTPQTSYAVDYWKELPTMFKSLDQQGYQAWKEEKYGAAEAFFENTQWRASAMYRQGKYEQAAKLFAHDKTPNGHYNRGNALAMSGELDEARKAYEKALQIDPNFTKAQDNLAVVNNLLAQQPNTENQNDDKGSKNTQNSEQSNDEQDAKDTKSSPEQAQNQANSENNKNSEMPENQAEDSSPESQKSEGNNTEQDSTQDKESDSGEQASESQSETGTGQNGDPLNQQDNSVTDNQKDGNQTGNGQAHNDLNNDLNDSDNQGAIAEAADSDTNLNESSDKQAVQPSKLNDNPLTNENESINGALEGAQKPNALSEQEQAKQAWLKQIPDQPGVFLKRKFEYQFQQNPQSNEAIEKQW